MPYQTTATGLQYDDVTPGSGEEARTGQHVRVHYTGWLYENGQAGRKFDSSKDRGEPFSFPLGAGHVIRGWDEGVAGMKVGGTRRLVIPPQLGYGARGAGGGGHRWRVQATGWYRPKSPAPRRRRPSGGPRFAFRAVSQRWRRLAPLRSAA